MHIGAYDAINIQTELDRNGNQPAADDKRDIMDSMVLFIAKERLPVRIVESVYLMRLLPGEHFVVCIESFVSFF